MADERIKWANTGGLKTNTPQRLKDFGYTTSTGDSSGTPEYPILEYDNFWRSGVSEVVNSNLDRLDNLAAADVDYQFVIDSQSNIVVNNPFDTFTTRYGTASSNAGTTTLASQVTASDYSGTFTRSTQYAKSGDFRRILETNEMLFFQGARIDGDTAPKYMYGLNDVGGIDYYNDAELSKWGFPIHRYDEILGDYVLDHRVGAIDLYPNFSPSFGVANTPIINVMQHNNILYVVFGRVAPSADTDKGIFQLVKYDMENRVVLFTKSLVSVLATPTGVLSSENITRAGDDYSGYMDISPDGTRMAVVVPLDVRNETLPQKNGFLKPFHLSFTAFIVDISDPSLNYSDISDVKDWSSSGTLRDCYARPDTYDVLKWGDDNTLHLISQFTKITDIEGFVQYAGYPYVQYQKIDVSGLTATNNTTTDLTTLIIDSSSTLTSTNRTSKAFGADFNMDIQEFCIRTAGGGAFGDANANPYVLNRFDLNSLTILATNENFPPSLFGVDIIQGALPNMRNFYYDKNGKIIFTAGFFNVTSTVGVRMVYFDQQFTSGTSISTVTATDLPVTVAADDSAGNEGNLDALVKWSSLIVYPTHTRFLSLMFLVDDYNYITDTKRSGGNYLNATSNIQYFDDSIITALFDNIPLADSILPYIKKVKYNPSTGSLTNVKSFVLAFDTTQATGGSQAISIVANGSTYNITGTGADWPTLLSDLADNLFAQSDFVNNAVVIDNKAIYVTLSYPKDDTTFMVVDQNVSLSSGNCTIGSFELSSMDSSPIEDVEAAYLYLVDYTSLSTAMSSSFTDITFKQYDTYVTSINNVQQAVDALFKIVQDLQQQLNEG